jgi:formate dehydrogenase
MTKERFEKAKNLKCIITAGIGSDHTDLAEACARNVDVYEVTGSNSISVAEHEVLTLLALVRNFVPSHQIAASGGWNIADCVQRSYDVEGMEVGTIGAGRIGQAVLRRLHPFGVKLHYADSWRLPESVEQELGLTYHSDIKEMVKNLDAVIVNCPLHPGTEHMFNHELLYSMRKGSYIVNCARGKIMDCDALAEALKSGQIAGYGGDVWFPQPAPADHPWRSMPNNAMVPHMSGTSLSGQNRYAAGTREILECWLEGRPIRNEYLIVQDGKLAGAGAHAYQPGNTTTGAK